MPIQLVDPQGRPVEKTNEVFESQQLSGEPAMPQLIEKAVHEAMGLDNDSMKGLYQDKVDNNSQQGIVINEINGNVLTLASNLANSYTGTGVVGGAYVTTYQTGYGRTVGSYTLGNEDSQNGIHLLDCDKFIITQCSIHDIWESPIKLGCGFDTEANNIAGGCTYGIITANRCTRGYDQGVSIWNSQYIVSSNNYCEDAGWGGCVLTGSDDCIMANNILRNNYYRIPNDNSSGFGAVIEGGSRNIIQGNQIQGNYAANVLMRISPLTFGVSGTTLASNASWGATTISVASASGFVEGATYMINDGSKSESFKVTDITGTTLTITPKLRFYHPSGKAVGVRTAEDNTIEGNEITESQASHGVFISPGIRTNIRNNTIARNYAKGILIEQNDNFKSAGTIADGNFVTGNGNGTSAQGILVDNVDDVQIINNRVHGNFGDKAIQLKGSYNSRVVGNSVSDNQSDGIVFENSGSTQCSKIVVANNDVKQCDGAGFKVMRGNHMTFMGNSSWSNAGDGGYSFGGLIHSTVSGNLAIDNAGNGMLFKDDNSVACTWNVISNNVVRDDGTSVKGSDGSALTQSVAIKLQDNEDNNTLLNNQVDVATASVGGSTTVADLIN